jgi:hypothetical protein
MSEPSESTGNHQALPPVLRRLVLPLLLALAAGITLDGAVTGTRTFTDVEGRTIEAEVLDANTTEIKFRRDDGRVFEFPRVRLSEPDQAFIDDWIRERAFAFGGLELSAWRVRIDAKRAQTRSTQEIREQWCYKMKLVNESRSNFDNLVVFYRVFHRKDVIREKDQDPPLEREEGRIVVGSLPAGEEIQIQTAAIELNASQLKIGWKHVGTGKRRIEDSLEGIWCRVMIDDDIIKEFANPSDLARKQSW